MILDGQSNRTLVRSEPLDYFDIHSTPKEYTLSSCSGKSLMSGRRANGFVIISLDRKSEICLPEVIQCQGIPNSRNEIPTPDIIRHHPHLRRIMTELNPLDCEAEILLLVGRDAIDAHHVLDQVLGPSNSPFAQRLTLGWAILGDMCIGRNHSPDKVNSCKTYLLTDGRATVFPPCPNKLKVSDTLKDSEDAKWLSTFESEDGLASNIFERTKDNDTVGLSIEDREIIDNTDGKRAAHRRGWSLVFTITISFSTEILTK